MANEHYYDSRFLEFLMVAAPVSGVICLIAGGLLYFRLENSSPKNTLTPAAEILKLRGLNIPKTITPPVKATKPTTAVSDQCQEINRKHPNASLALKQLEEKFGVNGLVLFCNLAGPDKTNTCVPIDKNNLPSITHQGDKLCRSNSGFSPSSRSKPAPLAFKGF